MTNEKSVILTALALLLIGGVFYTIDPTLTGKAYSDQNLQQAEYNDQDSVVYAQQDEQQRKEATFIILQQRAEEFERPIAVNQPIDEFYMHVLTMTGAMPVSQGTTFADLNPRAINNIISALDYMIAQQASQQTTSTDDAAVVDATQDQPIIPDQQVVTIIVDDKPASVDADIVIDIISSSDDIDQLVQDGIVIIDPDTGQLEIPQGTTITVSDDGAIQITTSAGQSTVIESSPAAADRIEQEVARERIKMATGISLDSYSLSFGKRYDVVTGVSDEPTRTAVLLSERAGTVKEERSVIGNVIRALKSLFNPLGIFGGLMGIEPPKPDDQDDGCYLAIDSSFSLTDSAAVSDGGEDGLSGRRINPGEGFGLGDLFGGDGEEEDDETPPTEDYELRQICRDDGRCQGKGSSWHCDPVECKCVEYQFPGPTELKCEGSAPATVTYSADSGKVKMSVCQAAQDRAVELCIPRAVSDYKAKAKVACDKACAIANSNPECGGKFPPMPKSICQASACSPSNCGGTAYGSRRCESQAQGQATASITCQCGGGGASSAPPAPFKPTGPTTPPVIEYVPCKDRGTGDKCGGVCNENGVAGVCQTEAVPIIDFGGEKSGASGGVCEGPECEPPKELETVCVCKTSQPASPPAPTTSEKPCIFFVGPENGWCGACNRMDPAKKAALKQKCEVVIVDNVGGGAAFTPSTLTPEQSNAYNQCGGLPCVYDKKTGKAGSP